MPLPGTLAASLGRGARDPITPSSWAAPHDARAARRCARRSRRQRREGVVPKANKIRGYWAVGSVDGDEGGSLFIHAAGEKCGRWSDSATDQYGDLLDLVRETQRLDLPGACRWAESFLALPSEQKSKRTDSRTRLDRERDAQEIWHASRCAAGTLVE